MNVFQANYQDMAYGETSEFSSALLDPAPRSSSALLDPVPRSKLTSFPFAVCGGAGAGPTWVGQSGVHINMTREFAVSFFSAIADRRSLCAPSFADTRITDMEV